MLAPAQLRAINDYYNRRGEIYFIAQRHDCDYHQLKRIIADLDLLIPGKGLDYNALLAGDPIANDPILLQSQITINRLDEIYTLAIQRYHSSNNPQTRTKTTTYPADQNKLPSFSDASVRRIDPVARPDKEECTSSPNPDGLKYLTLALKTLDRSLRVQLTSTKRREKLLNAAHRAPSQTASANAPASPSQPEASNSPSSADASASPLPADAPASASQPDALARAEVREDSTRAYLPLNPFAAYGDYKPFSPLEPLAEDYNKEFWFRATPAYQPPATAPSSPAPTERPIPAPTGRSIKAWDEIPGQTPAQNPPSPEGAPQPSIKAPPPSQPDASARLPSPGAQGADLRTPSTNNPSPPPSPAPAPQLPTPISLVTYYEKRPTLPHMKFTPAKPPYHQRE